MASHEDSDLEFAKRLQAEEMTQNAQIYDIDEELARKLQLEEEEEYKNLNETIPNQDADSGSARHLLKQHENLSLIDPEWEMIDPTPNIHALFQIFDDEYFGGRLKGCEVRWSPRMTLCAGLCCYQYRSGYCSIRLSKPLLSLRPRKDLVETLLHEMIHAVLFVTHNNRDRDGHGPEFHKHMYRINKKAGTNITVYHDFHDEVRHFKKHHWRCNGPCKDRKPFYGWVKRSMNRAPSKNDLWWAKHEADCGGTFTKVSGPEKQESSVTKPQKRKHEKNSSEKGGTGGPLEKYFKADKTSEAGPSWRGLPPTNNSRTQSANISGFSSAQGSRSRVITIKGPVGSSAAQKSPTNVSSNSSSFVAFGGTGHVLGTSSSNKSSVKGLRQPSVQEAFQKKKESPSTTKQKEKAWKLLDLFSSDDDDEGEEKKKKKKDEKESKKGDNKQTKPNSSETIVIPEDDLVQCPVCLKSVSEGSINSHLDSCVST